MPVYAWVSEGSIRKFNRAVTQLSKENATRKANNLPEVEITEEQIKELYVKWGGLVLGDAESVKGVEEGAEEAAVERSAAADAEAETEGKITRTKKKK